jgi:hypothetical protein
MVMLKGGIRCYRMGAWGMDKEESSNFREFKKISMDALREEAAARNLQNTLIFLCTDNSTIKATLVQGTLPSEKLFELIMGVRLD